MPSSAPLVLDAWFDRWDHTRGLLDGTVVSDRLQIARRDLNFATAVRAATRERALDLTEMPLTTLILARRFGLPYVGLPIVLCRDFHQRSIVVARDGPIERPEDLRGRRIGVRAYSVTTGLWARGLLQNEHGVDPQDVTWVTTEDSHLQEFRDPPNVERRAGASLLQLLTKGEIDAAIGLKGLDFGAVRFLYADVAAATAGWFARTGVYPINHVVAVKGELLRQHPWLAAELLRMFEEAKAQSMAAGWSEHPTYVDGSQRDELLRLVGPDLLPNGYARNRPAIAMGLTLAAQQQLTEGRVDASEVFANYSD